MSTEEFFKQNGYAVHKGYMIKKTLTGEIFIEKNKSLIGWAKTLVEAQGIIDELYCEGID